MYMLPSPIKRVKATRARPTFDARFSLTWGLRRMEGKLEGVKEYTSVSRMFFKWRGDKHLRLSSNNRFRIIWLWLVLGCMKLPVEAERGSQEVESRNLKKALSLV